MGSSQAGQGLFAQRRKELRTLARWRRSEGRTPTAREGSVRRRPGVTVRRGEGRAHLHSGRGGRPGGLL